MARPKKIQNEEIDVTVEETVNKSVVDSNEIKTQVERPHRRKGE